MATSTAMRGATISTAVLRAGKAGRAAPAVSVTAPRVAPTMAMSAVGRGSARSAFAGSAAPLRASRTLGVVRSAQAAFSVKAVVAEAIELPQQPPLTEKTRVRFAPSPTGTLHVGGARTALFNWLWAKHTGGEFILRVEDTDAARSTRESEEMVLRDLEWLGLDWDEGPDKPGKFGPYRQSERKDIYLGYAMKLVEAGVAFPCFCTDEELEAMKADAEAKKLPPIYRGKWASASKEDVDAEMAKGTPYCYRFRVPKDERVVIQDIVRGEVGWDTNTLGDFVLLRSNGLPVYNFCVAIDDALMGITHVMRAEEHLPNTLRQALVYKALGFEMPQFGHMSLILAPDKSKLSKRHGATSVGEFKEQGYLAEAMINYLSLLGWNDGTEKEIYTTQELIEAFDLGRITKSGAVFDKTKLSWMNGQHLRSMPDVEALKLVGGAMVADGIVSSPDSVLVEKALELSKESLEVVGDASDAIRGVLGFDFETCVADAKAAKVVEDGFEEIVDAVIAAAESGDLAAAAADGGAGIKGWMNGVGKATERKGKRLFMPMRVALTGRMQGPDVGAQLGVVAIAGSEVADAGAFVDLNARVEILKKWRATR